MTTAAIEQPIKESTAARSSTPIGLAPDTVRTHVHQLKPYVPGKPIEEVKRELGLPDDLEIFKLASNENLLGPSPAAVEAMKNAASGIWLYPDDTCYDLKNELAKFWNLTTEHFVIGNGSDEIIHFLMLAFLEKEDEVLFAEPSFVQYKAAAMMAGCAYKAVPLTKDYRHDLAAMKAAINENTKLIFIANPNNPTGTVVSRDEFESFLEGLPPRVIVVLDQAYYEYVEDDDSPEGLDYIENHNVVLLHTFSKAYALAGLRCGYGLARPEIIGVLQQVRGPFNVNALAQAAAIASLGDETQVEKARANNEEGKAQFYRALDEMKLEYAPTQANFVFFDSGRPAKEMFAALLRRGIIVRTGDPFGMPSWLRVTIGAPAMNERFISALREILNEA